MNDKIGNFQIINQLELDAKHITCGKCKIWLTTPIFLHEDGSNYCATCSPLMTSTSSACHQNDALGHVLANLKYPCLFENCDFIASQQNIQNHMRSCTYRCVTCLICKQANLDEFTIATHLVEKHANIVTNAAIEEPVTILTLDKPLKDDKIFIVTLKDNTFIVFVKFANGVLSFKGGKQKRNESILDDMFLIQYETEDNELKVKGKTSSMKEIIESFDKPLKLHMNLSEDDFKNNQIELKLYFNGFQLLQCIIDECPICLNKLTKEIYQCPNGHNVCSLCTNNINNCAICQSAMSKTKIDLKHVFSNIPFPCPNADAGCIHFMKFNDLDKHIVDCLYVKVNCVLCKESFTKLNILEHMSTEHAGQTKSLEKIKELKSETGFEKAEHYVIFKNQMFHFKRTTLGTDDNLKLCYNVRLLYNDDKTEAYKYRYEIQIMNKDTDEHIAKHKVDNICQSLSDDSVSSTINWSVCKPFLHEPEPEGEIYFYYRLCIYEFNC